MITTTNPRTGARTNTGLTETTSDGVAAITVTAAAASAQLASSTRAWRAELLNMIADALEQDRTLLISTAEAETGLSQERLGDELTRSIVQFQMFGDVLREGSYLEAIIDHAVDTATGPAPDIRRMLVPIGPVAVFGSSNFPFAFSVAGGDTASALAAGNPIVLKAHSAHPLTSARSFTALVRAARASGAPEGTIGIVFGQHAGSMLVADPHITAVSFTGSLGGGMALQRIINDRPRPIPLFAELSSLNPLIVSEGAASARAERIAEDLFRTVTNSAGQLCTKPGVAFVPASEAGSTLVDALATRVSAATPQVLLNDRIYASFRETRDRVTSAPGSIELGRGDERGTEGFAVSPTLVATAVEKLSPALFEEAFGPLIVVVRYADSNQLTEAFDSVPYSLTATIHHEPDEIELARSLTAALAPMVGRMIYNGYPTGVRVSWAQHHGGPWPATNSHHTSVGATAIRRFLRPLAWQNAENTILPEELRDGAFSVPRRVDGVLQVPDSP